MIRVALATAGLLLAGVPSVTLAADFSIQPIAVHLGKGNATQTLSILNRGIEPVRLQVTGFAWDQDAQGDTKLTATDDVIFFPQLVTVPAGERRAIRVGMAGATSVEKEKTYRVFVEELPSLQSQLAPKGAVVNVRTKMGVPIFVDPSKPSPKGEVSVASVRGGHLQFAVANHGNAHFLTQRISVVGEGPNGKVFETPVNGWYVLAGEQRAFDVALPKECGKAHSITINVQSDAGEFKTTAPVAAGSCV